MTLEELRSEAKKHGYKLAKKPDYQCSCYMPYPNENHRCKNGKWKCVDKYEQVEDYEPKSIYSVKTRCRRKVKG